jgi:hypothetical protein
MEASSLVSGLRSRHDRSQQPSSKALVATIDAVNEILDVNRMDKTIVAYFGACISALERASLLENADTVTALCTLLAAVMAGMPGAYIRSKFSTVSGIICGTLNGMQSRGEVLGQRAVLQCLVHALRNLDMSSTWAPVKAPFMALVKSTMDSNPKVRKVALDGLTEVMASIASNTAAQQAACNDLTTSPLPLLCIPAHIDLLLSYILRISVASQLDSLRSAP